MCRMENTDDNNDKEAEDKNKLKTAPSDEAYRDYADVSPAEVCRLFASSTSGCSTSSSSSGTTRQHNPHASGSQQQGFAVKLHYMISDIEASGDSSIVSWQPHGRCFVVHDRQAFVDRVLPSYFMQSTFASFQRQCNLYGFKRISSSQDKGGYYHELFLRAKPELAPFIQRIKRKGKGPRKPDSPETEPDFYSMTFLPSSSPPTTSSAWPSAKRRREQSDKSGSPPSSNHRPTPASTMRPGPDHPPYWYHGGYPPYHHPMMQPQPLLHPGHHYPHPAPYPSREQYEAYSRGYYPPPYHPHPPMAESGYENHHPPLYPPPPPPHYYGSMHGGNDSRNGPYEGFPPQTETHAPTHKDYEPDIHGSHKYEPDTHESHRREEPIPLKDEPGTHEPVAQPAVWGDPPGAQDYIRDPSCAPRDNEASAPPREVVEASSGGSSNLTTESSAPDILQHSSWQHVDGEREDDFWSRMAQ